jgi:hypothetical protein
VRANLSLLRSRLREQEEEVMVDSFPPNNQAQPRPPLLTYLFTCAVFPHGPGRVSPGNVRSGMSRSHQYRIRPLSHLAAWSIWFALNVRYAARSVSLLSTLFTSAGIRFQSSITRMLKKFLLWSSLPCFTFKLYGSAVLLVALRPFYYNGCGYASI